MSVRYIKLEQNSNNKAEEEAVAVDVNLVEVMTLPEDEVEEVEVDLAEGVADITLMSWLNDTATFEQKPEFIIKMNGIALPMIKDSLSNR